jgi:hypothetical protein
MRDGRREMREIVIRLAHGAGIFSGCADTISRDGVHFNPHYEAVSAALGLVYDCIEPLEVVDAFILGFYGCELDLTGLSDTEVQFTMSLWHCVRDLAYRLQKIASETSYEAVRTNEPAELRAILDALRYLEAVAQLSMRLHLAKLEESGVAKQHRLEQLREFISPELIDDWASLRPDPKSE